MSETDDEFWEEIYENYVSSYIDEDFPEDDEKGFSIRQGLVADEGEARDKLHSTLFNKIVEANRGGVYDKIPFFKNARNHGLVRNSDTLARIAQTKLEDSVGKEEQKRLDGASKDVFEIIERGQKPAKVLKEFREKKIVTSSAKKRREELEAQFLERRESAEILEKRGLTTSALFRRLGSASSREEVDAVLLRAEEKLSGKNLAEIRKAAETRKGEI